MLVGQRVASPISRLSAGHSSARSLLPLLGASNGSGILYSPCNESSALSAISFYSFGGTGWVVITLLKPPPRYRIRVLQSLLILLSFSFCPPLPPFVLFWCVLSAWQLVSPCRIMCSSVSHCVQVPFVCVGCVALLCICLVCWFQCDLHCDTWFHLMVQLYWYVWEDWIYCN